MPYIDTTISQGSVRAKRSAVPGEAPTVGSLRPGESAVNTADGRLFVGKINGEAAEFPSAAGISKIVTMTQSEYDELAEKDASTLYVVTADPTFLPGAPSIVSIVEDASTLITIAEPEFDGNTPITDYVFYVDGVVAVGFPMVTPLQYSIAAYQGDVVEVAAVNAVGEGPKSAPVTAFYP